MRNRPASAGRALAAAGALSLLAAASASGALAFEVSEQIGPDPVLPEPQFELVPQMKIAEVVGWSDGETPTVADGLAVTPYATDLANPRTVHTLPNGDVLVVESRAPSGKPVFRPKDYIRGLIMDFAAGDTGTERETNRITLLRDSDRDGTVDEQHALLTDLASPFGVAYADGTLYVAATDAILAYPYTLGEDEITAEPEILTPLPGGPINHHWTKDLALSPDGRFLYASVGSNSNVAEKGLEAEKGRAAIWQVDRETGLSRVYASGLRNPNGLTFHPETGALWTVVNERDELGPNLVPDYLTSVQDGGFYGWPWSYFGDNLDPRMHPPRPDMVATAIKPDYSLSSHVAPLGLAFTNGSAVPPAYAAGAFVGQRGSWNRSAFNGYKVVYIPFEDGMPNGQAVDVVTGFLDGDTARGRPVGVAIDGTGALLIADDAGNTVWRVAAADGTTTPAPIGTDRTTAMTDPAAADTAATEAQADASSDEAQADAPSDEAQADVPSDEAQADTPSDEAPAGTEVETETGAAPDTAQPQIAPAVQPQPGTTPAQ